MKKVIDYSDIPMLLLIAALTFVPVSCKKDPIKEVSYPGTSLTSVIISGTNWAPVNAGYVASTLPNGLLFQWGRMYGQDYVSSGIVAGTVAIGVGNNSANGASFYTFGSDPYDWCAPQATSWNMSSYNPCPTGWRVPTSVELSALKIAGSTWVDAAAGNPDGLPGMWFGGNHSGDHVGSIFMPVAGFRNVSVGAAVERGKIGGYWSSDVSGKYALSLYFYNSVVDIAIDYRAGGMSVRCVR